LTCIDFFKRFAPKVLDFLEREEAHICIQGIIIRPETPLLWLLFHCTSADLFLYLIVRRNHISKKLMPRLTSRESVIKQSREGINRKQNEI
jgi:hypothetical protein